MTMQDKTYFDDISADYDSLYADTLSLAENEFIRKTIVELLCGKQNIDVLDLGCGTGLMGELLGSHLGNYHGEDISESMLKIARTKFSLHKNFSFNQGDINHGPYLNDRSSGKVDVVLSTFGSASYIDNLDTVLHQIYQKLKYDGVTLLMFYSRFSIRNILQANVGIKSMSMKHRRSYRFRNDITEGDTNKDGECCFHDSKTMESIASHTSFRSRQIIGLNYFLDQQISRKSSIDDFLDGLIYEIQEIPYPDLAHSLILTLKK